MSVGDIGVVALVILCLLVLWAFCTAFTNWD